MLIETSNATQTPGQAKRDEDNGIAEAQDACDRRCPQRMHYPTIIHAPSEEASTKLLPSQAQAQAQPQVPVPVAARSAPKTDEQMQKEKFIDGELGSASQPPASPSTADLQSFVLLGTKGTLDCRAIDVASKEQVKHDSKNVRHRTEKKELPSQRTFKPGPRRRPSSDVRAASPRACSLQLATRDMSRTEQQLLSSQSNYEILQSSNPLPNNVSFPASLIASVDSKRAQHQREEKFRRDRMKRAMDALADVLPHKPGAQAAASRVGSRDTSKTETVEHAIEYIKELHNKYSIETNAEDKL